MKISLKLSLLFTLLTTCTFGQSALP
ncbi:MAG: hypothetical protein JWQ57_4293, partial [Mucilaginibacter sp.]|nr:hypothetical protein [Mucilaginibacter sp.]